jgi:hypothetical protein
MINLNIKILKKPSPATSNLVLFSTVRNEIYFIKHFIQHYRKLGIREYWFLDDHSTDGTLEFLAEQVDCGIIRTNVRFGEEYQGKRFGIQARTLIPRKLFLDKWVLTADADEFLIIPPEFNSLEEITTMLDKIGLKAARAIMVDFFPKKLNLINSHSTQTHPFICNPYYDSCPDLDWPDLAPQPQQSINIHGVRVRLVQKLLEENLEMRNLKKDYKYANFNKIPLVRWSNSTTALTAHHINEPTSSKIQLMFAHFKFYPGIQARIQEAIETKAYWNNSIEYKFLKLAMTHLDNWDLAGPNTHKYSGTEDLVKHKLINYLP